jgi:hypothetical protein
VEAGGVDVERSRYRVLIDQSTEKFDSNEDVKKRLRQVLREMTRKMKVNSIVSALGSCCSDGE